MREFIARAIAAAVVFALLAAAVVASAWVIAIAWRIFRTTAGLDG